jgi:hypothetical protein
MEPVQWMGVRMGVTVNCGSGNWGKTARRQTTVPIVVRGGWLDEPTGRPEGTQGEGQSVTETATYHVTSNRVLPYVARRMMRRQECLLVPLLWTITVPCCADLVEDRMGHSDGLRVVSVCVP